MKLKSEFIVHNTGTETIMVPAGKTSFTGLVKGNKTLGAILELLKSDTTEEAISTAMLERFDAPEEVIRMDVKEALDELRRIDALDE